MGWKGVKDPTLIGFNREKELTNVGWNGLRFLEEKERDAPVGRKGIHRNSRRFLYPKIRLNGFREEEKMSTAVSELNMKCTNVHMVLMYAPFAEVT